MWKKFHSILQNNLRWSGFFFLLSIWQKVVTAETLQRISWPLSVWALRRMLLSHWGVRVAKRKDQHSNITADGTMGLHPIEMLGLQATPSTQASPIKTFHWSVCLQQHNRDWNVDAQCRFCSLCFADFTCCPADYYDHENRLEHHHRHRHHQHVMRNRHRKTYYAPYYWAVNVLDVLLVKAQHPIHHSWLIVIFLFMYICFFSFKRIWCHAGSFSNVF